MQSGKLEGEDLKSGSVRPKNLLAKSSMKFDLSEVDVKI